MSIETEVREDLRKELLLCDKEYLVERILESRVRQDGARRIKTTLTIDVDLLDELLEEARIKRTNLSRLIEFYVKIGRGKHE